MNVYQISNKKAAEQKEMCTVKNIKSVRQLSHKLDLCFNFGCLTDLAIVLVGSVLAVGVPVAFQVAVYALIAAGALELRKRALLDCKREAALLER